MRNFFLKYKIILLITGLLAITLIIGYFIYLFFFRPVISPPAAPGTLTPATTTPGTLPTAQVGPGQVVVPGSEGNLQPEQGNAPQSLTSSVAQGGLTQTKVLNTLPSLGTTMGADGANLQFYNSEDGKFYSIDKNGQATLLSDQVFHDVDNVTWSPDKNKAILEYPDGANIVYDFNTDTQATLPNHWKDFAFSPDGGQIVMKSIGQDPDNRWLAVSNADGSQARPVAALGDKDDTVYPSWSPNKQSVAMYTEGVDLNRQDVYFVGLNSENFKSMTIEGRGFQYQWAPQGGQMLYSVYSTDSDMKPTLWIANAQGDTIGSGRKNLNIETWADKCAYAGATEIFCAVPDSLPEGAGLFPDLAKGTSDKLYQIDTRTGVRKLIAIPDASVSMSDLMLSDNGYYLYFIDNNTGNLEQIKLK